MENSSFKVFDNYFMDSGGARFAVSQALPMRGDRVTMTVLLRNVSGSPAEGDIIWKIQGTYDNVKWFDLSNTEIDDLLAFGHRPISIGSVDVAYVRIAVEMTDVGDQILFDAWLAFASIT